MNCSICRHPEVQNDSHGWLSSIGAQEIHKKHDSSNATACNGCCRGFYQIMPRQRNGAEVFSGSQYDNVVEWSKALDKPGTAGCNPPGFPCTIGFYLLRQCHRWMWCEAVRSNALDEPRIGDGQLSLFLNNHHPTQNCNEGIYPPLLIKTFSFKITSSKLFLQITQTSSKLTLHF